MSLAPNYPTNSKPFFPMVSLEISNSIISCSAYRIFCVVPSNLMANKLSLKLTTTLWRHSRCSQGRWHHWPVRTSWRTPWWWWTSPRRKEGSLPGKRSGHRLRAKVTEVEALEVVDLAFRAGENLAEDILGIFGRPEVDKPKAASNLIEDKGDKSKLREGVTDHLLLEWERTSALNREHQSEVVEEWEFVEMFREFIRIHRFVLLVLTVSDSWVIFVLLSCRGFLNNITTDRFTFTNYSRTFLYLTPCRFLMRVW